MRKSTILSITLLLLTAVFLMYRGVAEVDKQAATESENSHTTPENPAQDEEAGLELEQVADIPSPEEYNKLLVTKGSFEAYLRSIPLKEDRTVYLYDGTKKYNQQAQYAVLDISVGNRDLQQCADAVMRLRAEYLWHEDRKDEIGFHFTNGDWVPWSKYSQGFRPKISGSAVIWIKSAQPSSSRVTFDKYLDLIFSYAGTASLKKELKIVDDPKEVRAGDVFIQSGNPYGHAVIVLDIAENESGDRKMLLAQSYMPAQDIHILKNPEDRQTPWYEVRSSGPLTTPQWGFYYQDLRRF